MRKIISILLILTMIIGIFAGCSNNKSEQVGVENVENIETPEIDENIENPDVDTNDEQVENDDSDEEEPASFMLSLKPTHSKTTEYPFKDWDDWSVDHDFSDLSHLNGGYYSFHIPAKYSDSKLGGSFNGSWDEMKDLPVEHVEEYSSSCPIYIHYIDDDGEENYAPTYELDENLSNMTIQEAIEEGYWSFTNESSNGFNFTEFFDSDPGQHYVREIIDVWGMPSEVYYIDSDLFVNFFLVYETNDYSIILIGNHILTTDDDNGLQINAIRVCGKNSSQSKFDTGFFSSLS